MLVDAFQLPWILYYYLMEEVQLYMHSEGNGEEEEEEEEKTLLLATDYKM